jgi:hypothetical protein
VANDPPDAAKDALGLAGLATGGAVATAEQQLNTTPTTRTNLTHACSH